MSDSADQLDGEPRSTQTHVLQFHLTKAKERGMWRGNSGLGDRAVDVLTLFLQKAVGQDTRNSSTESYSRHGVNSNSPNAIRRGYGPL